MQNIQTTHPRTTTEPAIRLVGRALDLTERQSVTFDVCVPVAIAYGYEGAAQKELNRYQSLTEGTAALSDRRFLVLEARSTQDAF